MVIFHSYVSLPEGKWEVIHDFNHHAINVANCKRLPGRAMMAEGSPPESGFFRHPIVGHTLGCSLQFQVENMFMIRD